MKKSQNRAFYDAQSFPCSGQCLASGASLHSMDYHEGVTRSVDLEILFSLALLMRFRELPEAKWSN